MKKLYKKFIPLFFIIVWTVIFSLFYSYAAKTYPSNTSARTLHIVGPSMEPTLHDGNDYIANPYDSRNPITRGDIVACPINSLREHISLDDMSPTISLYIKRVVGLAGDSIMYDTEAYALRINGALLYEPYLKEEKYSWDIGEITVPDGHVFLLGDNRNHSTDSRVFGTISQNDIMYILTEDTV